MIINRVKMLEFKTDVLRISLFVLFCNNFIHFRIVNILKVHRAGCIFDEFLLNVQGSVA